MATITFIDNLPDPSLYGIDIYNFFQGATEVVHTMDEANSKYILTSNLGRRIEYTYFVDASSIPHTIKAEYYASDPTTPGGSAMIAMITDVDRIGYYWLDLNVLTGVDTVNGSNGSDVLTSYGFAGYAGDVLHGNGGDDVLTGWLTDTVLDGGTGNDTLTLWSVPPSGLSAFAANGGDGFDTIELRLSGSYSFRAVGEYAAISSVEKILFSATSGSTAVRLQSDQIAGLAHNLAVETKITDARFEISRKPGAAVDIDLSGWTFTGWSPDHLSYLQVVRYDLTEDAAYDDKVIGTLLNDLIRSHAGSDSLVGGFGNDTLVGGAGVDTVRGGDGDDVIVVSNGDSDLGDIIEGGIGDDLLVCEGDLRAATISGIEHVMVSGGKTTQFANTLSSSVAFETSGATAALVQVYASAGIQLNAKDWSLGTWSDGSGIEIAARPALTGSLLP